MQTPAMTCPYYSVVVAAAAAAAAADIAATAPPAYLSELVGPDALERCLCLWAPSLDGDLCGHAPHSEGAAAVARVDQQAHVRLRVCVHDLCVWMYVYDEKGGVEQKKAHEGSVSGSFQCHRAVSRLANPSIHLSVYDRPIGDLFPAERDKREGKHR
jgi:hypothetical protein